MVIMIIMNTFLKTQSLFLDSIQNSFLVLSRLVSSAKNVLEVEDVSKVLLYSNMHFYNRQLPGKTHHNYTEKKLLRC